MIMFKRLPYGTFITLLFYLSACSRDLPPTPTPAATSISPAPSVDDFTDTDNNESGEPAAALPSAGVFFSELLPGVPGGNNHEFIELYNAGSESVDLDGWSLWYLTRSDQEASLVYAWEGRTDIPGLGHYLLVHNGRDFGLIPDATYDVALFEGKGGLILRDADMEIVDRLGWGEAPENYFAGTPAAAPDGGASLERLPGGESGNGMNSGRNATDFQVRALPEPQNSGSPLTPLPPKRLAIMLTAPETLPPGIEFDYLVQVENLLEDAVSDVLVSVPVADHFTVVAMPAGAMVDNGRIQWSIDKIEAGDTASDTIRLKSPWANVDTLISGYFAQTADLPPTYGALQIVSMAGGSIPIAIARTLPAGSVVSVEGVATMYTGGFFAGSSSAKFYIEDESGGVQIFADGGAFDVSVAIGDHVRVTGAIEIFRDSVEIIPLDNVADVEILDGPRTMPDPMAITVQANETDEAVLGRLNVIEGTITRIEEFTFDYEVDLADENGNTTLVFIEKDTGVTAEPLDPGQSYRITGISELASGQRQLKPRLQSDIVAIFPPVLWLEMSAANNIQPGDELVYTITAYNHTDAPMTNIQITAVPPARGASLNEINDEGELVDTRIAWRIPELPGNGASVSVSYSVTVDEAEVISVEPAQALADQWPDPALTEPFLTFVGTGVPIWAIQGEGIRSPYVRTDAMTSGVVTAVFPDMNGFWIQDLFPDENPATSDGLFVLTEGLNVTVEVGDLLDINGQVREISGQTTLQPHSAADVVLNSSGYTGVFDPITYDPPADPAEALAYKESLEGMLVVIEQPALVVAPTTRFGEYALVYEKWDVDLIRRADEPVGYVMFVDDGSFVSHDDQSTLPYAVARGDAVTGVVGPLAYTFGAYKIEPIQSPQVVAGERPLPTIAAAGTNQFSVATFNVENLFDAATPHPSSPPQPTGSEYRHKLNKIAEAIVAMGAPTIIGLQEVENIGTLESLVAQEALAAYDYEPYLIEGNDSRGIDVAYLVRGDQATVEGVASHDAPGDLFARPPLVLTATIHLDSGDQTVILQNNHFLSLSAGEEATEPVRNAQAAWNVTIMEQLQADQPEALFIVMGDLNSFYNTPPLFTLQESGLRHVYAFFSEADVPYTYIFEGVAQTLDHILVSESLYGRLAYVEALHIDADYPILDPEDATPRRVSDHDPLVALFSFE